MSSLSSIVVCVLVLGVKDVHFTPHVYALRFKGCHPVNAAWMSTLVCALEVQMSPVLSCVAKPIRGQSSPHKVH